jgi:hypothetical protein
VLDVVEAQGVSEVEMLLLLEFAAVEYFGTPATFLSDWHIVNHPFAWTMSLIKAKLIYFSALGAV